MAACSNIAGNLEKHPALGLLLAWLAALVFLLLWSFNTSPLNPFYGGDSTIYTVLGRMTAEGALPYVDVYDHKGPLVFYIHALGWLIYPSKAGMLLLQSLALAASLVLTYRLCRLWGSARKSLAALGLFAAVYAACLWGGDMTEEYSLPLALLPAYLILRELVLGTPLARLPLRGAFAAGLCIGLLAFLRLNNAAPLCGVLLGLAGGIRTRQDFLYLLRYAGIVILGCLAASLPFLLYFAARGAAEAMLMGTFIHNLHYTVGHTAEHSAADMIEIGAKLLPLLLFLGLMWHRRAGNSSPRAAKAAAAGFGTLSLLVPVCGPVSSHYFITAAPAIALALVFFPTRRQIGILLFAGVLMLPFALDAAHLLAGFRRYNIIRNYQDEIDAAQRIAAHIPETERHSVWACDTHAAIYVYGGLRPCFRYFTRQSIHGRHNPAIGPAISQMMAENPPLWIIVPEKALSDQAAVQQALSSGAYTLRYRESEHLHLDLWQRNERPHP